ncbi:MAG: aquaporin [Chloroflexi bacterium]|nr:MAG: aquaporin [Chloroflexota bacterium]
MKHTPKLIAEFLGTFGLTFFGAGAICADRLVRGGAAFGPIDLLLIASAHAVVLGVMVSALGHLSGAHFNPAVTLGALIGRHITASVAVMYWATQLVAAIAAAGLLLFFFPSAITNGVAVGAPVPAVDASHAFVVEIVLTIFLVTVVYATAIDPRGAFGKIAGIAIGAVLFFDILVGGPLTGAAMNPARAFGPALVAAAAGVGGVLDGQHFLIYWLGPAIGGVIAALLYQRLLLRDSAPD